MSDSLSEKLQSIFRNVLGEGKVSASNVTLALREVRLALLKADMHSQVVKDFIARVKEKILREAVLKSMTGGQQMGKIFHDELTSLLGGDVSPRNLNSPTQIEGKGNNPLVESIDSTVSGEEAERMEEKLRRADFDFNDFLEQMKMMRRMGPLEKILGLIPEKDKADINLDEKMKQTEAIMCSMTVNERARPDLLNARRRQRIAAGSGTSVVEVNELITRFNQIRRR